MVGGWFSCCYTVAKYQLALLKTLNGLLKQKRSSLFFDIAYVPENLRLGKAINVFMNPERIVIGADDSVR